MKKTLWNIAAMAMVLLIGIACQQSVVQEDPIDADTNAAMVNLIKDMGFREDMIVDRGDYFEVEGDISFDKAILVKDLGRQSRYTYMVSDPLDVTVSIDSSMPTSGVDNWRTEISQAIADWNSVNSSRINFRLLTSGTGEIVIRSDAGALTDNTIAMAEWPTSAGAPGYRIRVNLDFLSNMTVSTGCKRYNMVHEMGHCIALRHTNWAALGESAGIQINGTAATDSASIMNGGTALNTWVGFSTGDRIAVSEMYPANWAGWYYFNDGIFNSAPAVCSWGSGRLDLFGRGTDNQLYHRAYSNGAWTAWECLGGVLYSAPTACSWGTNRIDVFAKGADGGMWQVYYDTAGWHGWYNLGGTLQSAPAACSWGSGRIDVFARGNGQVLIHKYYSGGWSAWETLDGLITSAPGVESWGYGRIDIFARGTDGYLWHKFYQSGWSGWENLGGPISAGVSPSVASRAYNTLDIFVRGTDNQCYRKQWTSLGWTDFQLIGGILYDSPATTSWSAGRIDLFVLSTNNYYYQAVYQE